MGMTVQIKPGVPCPNCGDVMKRVVGIRVNADDNDMVGYLIRCRECKQKMYLKSVRKKTGEWIFFEDLEAYDVR